MVYFRYMSGIFYLFCFCLGACFGSFLNAWLWRTRENKSIIRGRSVCPHCGRIIRWLDNVPLLSFWLLKGKCRQCSALISWRYPLVEAVIGLGFTALAYIHVAQGNFSFPLLIRDWTVFFILAFIFFYDWWYGEILDEIAIPASVLYLVSAWWQGWQSWQDMVAGACIGSGFFLFQYVVSRGRWIGGGDIRLGLLMGIVLGWERLLVALFIAYVGGALISLTLLFTKKKTMKSAIPFGVFLVPATMVAFLWGRNIIDWYVGLL